MFGKDPEDASRFRTRVGRVREEDRGRRIRLRWSQVLWRGVVICVWLVRKSDEQSVDGRRGDNRDGQLLSKKHTDDDQEDDSLQLNSS